MDIEKGLPSQGQPPTHEQNPGTNGKKVDEKLILFQQQLEEKLVRIEEAHDELKTSLDDKVKVQEEKLREQDEKISRMVEAHEDMKSLIAKKADDEEMKSIDGKVILLEQEMKALVEKDEEDVEHHASFSRSMAFTRVASTLALNNSDAGTLDEDTFSLMMVSKIYSRSWVLGWVSSKVVCLHL